MIAQALASYSAACDRANLDNRPLVWAVHFDIWKEPRGEIGLAVKSEEGQATAAFASLIPFVLVPEVGTSVLVLDCSGLENRELAVSQLSVTGTETTVTHYRVPFGIGDDGTLNLGSFFLVMSSAPFVTDQMLEVVTQAVDARQDRFGWEEAFSFDSSTQVAVEFLRQLAEV